jgi:imidazolonepropionase-like amidohydrolase
MRPRGHCHFLGGEVATPDQVRRRIETHLGQGASFVKLMASGGGLTPGTDPSAADLPRELVRAAVETAHASGAHVAAHCHATESIVRCLEEGVDTIEHASFVEPPGRYRFDPEVAARLGAAGIAVAPTVIGALRTARRFRASGALHNPSDAAAVERLEGRLTNTGHFHRLGLRILAGTDCGCTDTPFDSLVDELLAYTSAGLSRAEALRSATSGAAEILGLPETGEIRPGARADLLLVAADPLEGLEVLRRPDMVLRSGRVVHRRPGMEAPAVRG